MENIENTNNHFDFATKVGLDGKSAYEVAVDNGFVGDENAWIAFLKKPMMDAANEVIQTNKLIEEADLDRTISEMMREYDENKRLAEEVVRISSETERNSAESIRQVTTKEAVDKSNKAAEEALAITAAIASGENINPDLISPLQGVYTSISSPKNDATVQWTADITPIGTGDFTIQFCGAFDNSMTANSCACKLGTNGIMSNTNSVLIDSETDNNQLGFVWFPYATGQEYLDAGIPVYHTKAPQKPHCLLFGRKGTEAFVYANGGERKSVTLESVMELSNMLILSNASKTTLVRKFNFAINDEIAKSLYNGGRWSDKVVDSRYLISTIEPKTLGLAPLTKDDVDGGSVSTLVNNPTESILDITTAGTKLHLPTMHLDIANSATNHLSVDIEIDINVPDSSMVIVPRIFSGTGIIEPVGYTPYQEISSGSYKFTYEALNSNTTPYLILYTDGRKISTYTVKKISVYTQNLDNEYLPCSLTKTKWRDTHGDIDLLPTCADRMVFSTEPVLQEKLWGEGAPTTMPDAIGQEYIDTLNKVTYKAYNTTAVSDWSIL